MGRQRNRGPWEIDIEHGGYSVMFFEPMPQAAEAEFRRAEATCNLTPTAFD